MKKIQRENAMTQGRQDAKKGFPWSLRLSVFAFDFLRAEGWPFSAEPNKEAGNKSSSQEVHHEFDS
jgi:hypothetical protein